MTQPTNPPKITKESIETMLTDLHESFKPMTRSSEIYKNMFKSLPDDQNFRGFLRDLELAMTSAALDAMQAYEDKMGKSVTGAQFELLYALPWLAKELERTISTEQGFSCSVDKVYEVLNYVFVASMKDETDDQK